MAATQINKSGRRGFYFIFLFSFLFFFKPASAQVFHNWENAQIPDNNTWIEFPIEVSGLENPLLDTFGLAFVSLRLHHPYISDLVIRVRTPWGKEITLADRVGGDGDDMDSTVFGSFQFAPIITGSAPFNGTYRSQQSMGICNLGQNGNGTWRLRIKDVYPSDQGNFLGWHIHFSNQPAGRFPFTDSNLPIFVINTGNATISDEPKVNGFLQVIHSSGSQRNYISDSATANRIPMGIEFRGSSSQGFPKKSYGMELRNPNGEDTSLALLDLPPQSDWVLSANYTDKSFLRNTFAYHLSRKMGWYAPRTRYVEMVVNNEYQGVYVLTEKIKRDAERVNIAKLKPSDTSGANLTGGYIFKIDKSTGNDNQYFASSFPPLSTSQNQVVRFFYDYPKVTELHTKQKDYIKSYVDSFETALAGPDFQSPTTGYRKFINLPSFMDFFLVNEWSKNVDGYRISTYLTKPKINQNGGKLIAGPVWDFDIAWRNANYCNGQSTSGWSYNFPQVCPDDHFQPPFWWSRFREDQAFNHALRCRWDELITSIMPLQVRTAWIDSVASLLQESMQRNFDYWPILGQYVWPNPNPIPTTYAGEVSAFKSWLNNRQFWIQNNIGGNCLLGNNGNISGQKSDLEVFPNPTNGKLTIRGGGARQFYLIDILGKVHSIQQTGENEYFIPSHLTGQFWLYSDEPGRSFGVISVVKR